MIYEWHKLDHKLQQQVIHSMEKMIVETNDPAVEDAIIAAINELIMWSNDPSRLSTITNEIPSFDIVQAKDTDDTLN